MNQSMLQLAIKNLNNAKKYKQVNPQFLAYLENRVKVESEKSKLNKRGK